jgi:hypothetical protein
MLSIKATVKKDSKTMLLATEMGLLKALAQESFSGGVFST